MYIYKSVTPQTIAASVTNTIGDVIYTLFKSALMGIHELNIMLVAGETKWGGSLLIGNLGGV